MKKILAFVAVAFIAVASTFAAGAQIEGTWNDAKWNANWTLGADTDGNFAVILTNAKKTTSRNQSRLSFGINPSKSPIQKEEAI
ncbi:MAG: hypothetical protein II563_04925 [Treponema sp.]|nr:hypothetical protein [Treponema sp.]